MVLMDGHCSCKVLMQQGVPQGGVSSLTLYLLFINDLVPEIPKGNHATLYADDLVFCCSEEYGTMAINRMQLALDKSSLEQTTGVYLNSEKITTLFSLSAKAQARKLLMGDVTKI